MLSPYKIVWDNRPSTEFNVLTELVFDSDNGAVETHLSREAIVSETYNGAFKRAHNYKWSESFTFQITIVKNDFENFSPEENRRILKWLTGRSNAGFIDVYQEENPDEIAFSALGNFVNVSSYKLGSGRVVGYVADWESLMPFALSKLYRETKKISDPLDNKIIINIDTDDGRPVYPRITINHNYNDKPYAEVRIPSTVSFSNILHMVDYVENTVYYNGSVWYWKTTEPVWRSNSIKPDYEGWATVEVSRVYTIDDIYSKNTFYYNKNNDTYYWMDPYTFHASNSDPGLPTTSVKFVNSHTDLSGNKRTLLSTIVKNDTHTEKVVLDGANKIVSSDNTRRIFGDDFNWQWLELYDGTNEITIEGNCEVTLEWREVRKVGEY